MRISEAYGVLGNTEKRARYDRDVLRLHEHPQQPTRPGSYSSTTSGPAGARPASGLSRRRTTFRGPPPSFYRSGGWGDHGARRAAAHEESTGGGGGSASANPSSSKEQQRQKQHSSGWYTAYGAGGMGPGQEPFGKGSWGADIPHFDRSARAAHTRTQEWVAARRVRRAPFARASSDLSEIGGFFTVLAVLGVALGLPYLVFRDWSTEKKNKSRVGADEKVAKG